MLSRNSESSIMKILHHHSWLSCFCSYLLHLSKKLTRRGICCHCLKLFSPCLYSSASNCFWLRSVLAQVTQLSLTAFSSITSLNQWTWTIPTFVIPTSFCSSISSYYYLFLLDKLYTWIFLGPSKQPVWSHPSSCSPVHMTLHYGWCYKCFRDNSQLLIIIPDSSAQNTLFHIPPYQKSPIYPSITAEISPLL